MWGLLWAIPLCPQRHHLEDRFRNLCRAITHLGDEARSSISHSNAIKRKEHHRRNHLLPVKRFDQTSSAIPQKQLYDSHSNSATVSCVEAGAYTRKNRSKEQCHFREALKEAKEKLANKWVGEMRQSAARQATTGKSSHQKVAERNLGEKRSCSHKVGIHIHLPNFVFHENTAKAISSDQNPEKTKSPIKNISCPRTSTHKPQHLQKKQQQLPRSPRKSPRERVEGRHGKYSETPYQRTTAAHEAIDDARWRGKPDIRKPRIVPVTTIPGKGLDMRLNVEGGSTYESSNTDSSPCEKAGAYTNRYQVENHPSIIPPSGRCRNFHSNNKVLGEEIDEYEPLARARVTKGKRDNIMLSSGRLGKVCSSMKGLQRGTKDSGSKVQTRPTEGEEKKYRSTMPSSHRRERACSNIGEIGKGTDDNEPVEQARTSQGRRDDHRSTMASSDHGGSTASNAGIFGKGVDDGKSRPWATAMHGEGDGTVLSSDCLRKTCSNILLPEKSVEDGELGVKVREDDRIHEEGYKDDGGPWNSCSYGRHRTGEREEEHFENERWWRNRGRVLWSTHAESAARAAVVTSRNPYNLEWPKARSTSPITQLYKGLYARSLQANGIDPANFRVSQCCPHFKHRFGAGTDYAVRRTCNSPDRNIDNSLLYRPSRGGTHLTAGRTRALVDGLPDRLEAGRVLSSLNRRAALLGTAPPTPLRTKVAWMQTPGDPEYRYAPNVLYGKT